MSVLLSVVIPSQHIEARQQSLVTACLQQSLSSEKFEIILVVPNQGRHSEALLIERASIKVVKIPENNVSNARNQGILCAQGKYLLLLDDDVLPPDTRYFENVLRLAETFKIPFIVGGAYLNPEKISPVAATANTLANLWIQSGLKGTSYSDFATEARFLPGGALLASRSIFSRTLFPISIPWGGEDAVFIKHVQETGNKTFYSPVMDVIHAGNSSLIKFIRRAWFSGRAQTLFGVSTEAKSVKISLFKDKISLRLFSQFHLLFLHFVILIMAKQFYKIQRYNPNNKK
ncbi:MAG: glycosyltransferase [Bdellovibrio sp.]|nr:glycosyltransferase [Bdellovibrio sp.]